MHGITTRQSVLALGGVGTIALLALSVQHLAFAAPLDDPPGCNGDVRQRASPGPLGYSDRHDGGDARCEGLYQRDVAADNVPEISPMSFMLRYNEFTPSAQTVIALAWPHVRAPVSLCARHTVDSILYRMDAMRQAGDAPDQPATACDEFKWQTGVLNQVKEKYDGFEIKNLRMLAQVNVPLTGAVAEQFPEAMRGKPLLLPLLVNAPQDKAAAEPPATRPADDAPVRPTLTFYTNRELREVSLRCAPVNPKAGAPVERSFNAVPRGLFPVRSLELPAAKSPGEYWAVELTYQFRNESKWEQGQTLFYLMTPSAEYARWADSDRAKQNPPTP